MTVLTVYDLHKNHRIALKTKDLPEIREALAPISVTHESWDPNRPELASVDDSAVLDAFAPEIAALKLRGGYQTADIVRISEATPNHAALRLKFLDEHRHSEDEVRFFVEGSGAFYLRDDDFVYRVVCEAGDLLSVPAGIRHWFDMGPRPNFAAVRLFTNPEGWIANFTGDTIATQIPRFEIETA